MGCAPVPEILRTVVCPSFAFKVPYHGKLCADEFFGHPVFFACKSEVIFRLVDIPAMEMQVQSVDIGIFVHNVHHCLDGRPLHFGNPVQGTGKNLECPPFFAFPLRKTVGEFVKESLVVISIVILQSGIPVLPHRFVAHYQQGDVPAHVE